jgi:hypothetical protein
MSPLIPVRRSSRIAASILPLTLPAPVLAGCGNSGTHAPAAVSSPVCPATFEDRISAALHDEPPKVYHDLMALASELRMAALPTTVPADTKTAMTNLVTELQNLARSMDGGQDKRPSEAEFSDARLAFDKACGS